VYNQSKVVFTLEWDTFNVNLETSVNTNWTFISVTSTGSRDTKLYINSVEKVVDSQAGLGALNDIKEKYRALIGNNSSNETWLGYIWSFGISTSALTFS